MSMTTNQHSLFEINLCSAMKPSCWTSCQGLAVLALLSTECLVAVPLAHCLDDHFALQFVFLWNIKQVICLSKSIIIIVCSLCRLLNMWCSLQSHILDYVNQKYLILKAIKTKKRNY